jgi:hypothetical protein
MTCLFIFSLQFFMVLFIFLEMFTDTGLTMPADTEILCVRFFCAFLLHLILQGEILQTLKGMKFYLLEYDNFTEYW